MHISCFHIFNVLNLFADAKVQNVSLYRKKNNIKFSFERKKMLKQCVLGQSSLNSKHKTFKKSIALQPSYR